MKKDFDRDEFRRSLGLPKLELPLEPELTPEEQEEQRKVVEAIFALRDRIGPIDLTWEELSAEDDDDDDA